MTKEIEILHDRDRLRKEALMRRVLNLLRQSAQVVPMETDAKGGIRLRVEFTDESVRVVAPLIEAIDILEAIIFASDGCIGHRNCQHSMEPWQRARALLEGKWETDTNPERTWPDPEVRAREA